MYLSSQVYHSKKAPSEPGLRGSKLARLEAGGFVTPGERFQTIARLAHGGFRIPMGGASDHSSRGSQIACITSGKFTTPRGRFRALARADHSSRVPKLAGSSTRKGGFASWIPQITACVYRSWLVYNSEGAVSDHSSRGSQLACFIVGRFIAPRKRFRIIARVARSRRVSWQADSSTRGDGFGSLLEWIIACVRHSRQVRRPGKAVSDPRPRGS